MATDRARQSRSEHGWGIALSIIFGSFSWVVGMTIPGGQHGTNLFATIGWSLVLGSLAYAPGSLVGNTLHQLRPRVG